MGEYSQAISDFKKYLGSTPRPVDSTEVEEEMMDAFKAKVCFSICFKVVLLYRRNV